MDRLFVTLPMLSDEEADIEMVCAWQGRVRDNNKLVHLQSSAGRYRCVKQIWGELSEEDYVSPHDVLNDMSDFLICIFRLKLIKIASGSRHNQSERSLLH